jgi:3-oxoacyl-[acyl-carrier protein] reductase
MTGRHAGRVAVLTGGASGIGRAMAERLGAEGAAVAVLDLIDAGDTVKAIAAAGGRATAVECDVSDGDAVTAAVSVVRSRLGGVDIAVHCAAYQLRAPLLELTDAQWRRTMAVNVDGAFHLARAVIPEMVARGRGRIVLVASSSFFVPPEGMSHYIASKGALLGLTRGLAAEVGRHGVTVNALAPGLTRTSHALEDVPAEHFAAVLTRQAVKRSGEPEDQAAALSFLVSDDASFITGQTLLVDGGEGHV